MGRYKKAIMDYVDAIFCDGQLEQLPCYEEISELGREPLGISTIAKNAGWQCIGGQWFCPSCVAKKGKD